MYMGYRTEVKHTNHITIWLWDLLVFAQCFSSNSRADTCLHRLHPTAAFCTANHWTDWTPWGLRWWPPTLFVREKQKRTVFDVWQSKYIYLFPLLLPRLWGIHLEKKAKICMFWEQMVGGGCITTNRCDSGFKHAYSCKQEQFCPNSNKTKVKNRKKLKPISISKWENDQSTVSTKYTDTDGFTL